MECFRICLKNFLQNFLQLLINFIFMSDQTIKSTNCCESFNPEPWQDKEIIWQDKLFVKDHVTSFLHMPLNMGKVVSKNCELIDKAAAATPSVLLLSDEKSLWGADIYIEVTKNVPGAQMVTLSGKFLTKVFEGPWISWRARISAHCLGAQS